MFFNTDIISNIRIYASVSSYASLRLGVIHYSIKCRCMDTLKPVIVINITIPWDVFCSRYIYDRIFGLHFGWMNYC